MVFKPVSHVLFDLDGLLIDSEKMYSQAFETVSANYGKTFTWELNATLLGTQGHECADKIIEVLELPVTREQFMDECREVLVKLFPDVQLMPGAGKLVSHLYNKSIPIALATSSSQESVKMKMQNHTEFMSYFHHLTMGSSDPEVTKGKPDPAIFLVCASRFIESPKPEMFSKPHNRTERVYAFGVGVCFCKSMLPLSKCNMANMFIDNLIPCSQCLVFEDALNGVKAACAAKMQVVAVPDPRINKEKLNIATLVLDSLEDFQPELFGLPAYD